MSKSFCYAIGCSLIPLVASRSRKQRKPGQDASKFKTDDDTGKMIIDEDSDSDTAAPSKSTNKEDVVGTAYRDSFVSADGFTRAPSGRVKFNKDTKKRRRAEMEDGDADVDMLDPSSPLKAAKQTPKSVKIGSEFKAKVRLVVSSVG